MAIHFEYEREGNDVIVRATATDENGVVWGINGRVQDGLSLDNPLVRKLENLLTEAFPRRIREAD